MRAVPDVALTAAAHDGYIIAENGAYWIISGTSAASPSFAGVMALVVETKGSVGEGNANAGLYPLVNAQHNPFHATPSGNNSVPGVMGFTASGAAYNQATGLGSVDGALLVSEWGSGASSVKSADFALTASATAGTAQAGKTATFTVKVTESGAGKNAVALTAKAPAGVTVSLSLASILPGTASTVTVAVGATAAAGAQSITVTGSDATGTQSVTYALTVTQAPALTLTAASSSVAVVEGGSGTVSFTAATGGSFSGSISLSVSGLPAGVTAAWSANPVTPASGVSTNKAMLTLTASAGAKAGSANVVATAAGDGLTSSQSVVLQVQQPPGITLAALPAAVSLQLFSTATVTVTATPVGGATVQAGANGGSVSLYSENLTGIGGRSSALAVASAGGTSISVASGLPKGFTASWSTPGATYTGAVAWTLTLTGVRLR